jgi:hypothetical protein
MPRSARRKEAVSSATILTVQPLFEIFWRWRWCWSCCHLLDLGLLGMHPIGGLPSLADSGEDSMGIALQKAQP